MKSLRLAAATAAALASGAAFAQSGPPSVVEMYGTAMPFLESAETSGATAAAPTNKPSQVGTAAYTGVNDARRQRITVGTSNWGFRGYEQLAPELRLTWQLESAFQLDQNTGPGIGARNSKVGLVSPLWGEIMMGQWDTPYKFISLAINPLRAGYDFDYTPIMGNPGMGVPVTTTQPTRIGAKPDAAFDKRIGNVVQYWSPKWGGLSFRVAYQADEGTGPVAAGGPVVHPDIWSAAAIWELGPNFSIRVAGEKHRDYFGMSQLGGGAAGTATNSSSKDTAGKIVAIWKVGGFRVAAAAEQLKYHNDDSTAGNVNEYKRTAYYVLAEQSWGPNAVWASYGRAADGTCSKVGGADCVTGGLGADYWAAGYIYHFSKRTDGYITYYSLTNKESGQYSVQPVVGTAAAVAPGADIKAFGVGLLHLF